MGGVAAAAVSTRLCSAGITGSWPIALRRATRIPAAQSQNDGWPSIRWTKTCTRRIRLLMAAGQQQAALAHFDEVRELLARELDARPGQGTATAVRADSRAPRRRRRLVNAAAPADSPTTFPSALTPLIGRASELHRLEQLLTQDDHRLVTVTGEGGIGKSTPGADSRAAPGRRLRSAPGSI